MGKISRRNVESANSFLWLCTIRHERKKKSDLKKNLSLFKQNREQMFPSQVSFLVKERQSKKWPRGTDHVQGTDSKTRSESRF